MASRLDSTRIRGYLWTTALAALALTVSAGCQKPDEGLRADVADQRAPVRADVRRTVVGQSVEGRPIECLELGEGPDVVLIMATIHGNEPAGTPLVRQLVEHLSERPDLLKGKRVLLMPVANPDGLARGTRHNVHGVDLNRNFPAPNYQVSSSHGSSPLSEPESAAIHRVLEKERPNRIVSIHQPLACIDYDGPGELLARSMAAHTDLPVKKLGGRPGSLGSYAGIAKGIPIITVELPGSASQCSDDVLWDRYSEMLLEAIRFGEETTGAELRRSAD
jgi:protein MpaA